MDARDDLSESRGRSARLAAALASGPGPGPHAPRRYVGRALAPPSGSAAPCYVATNPVALSGPMAAGAAPTVGVDATRTVPVLCLGSLPGAGQLVVARPVAGRWVAYLPGHASNPYNNYGSLPGCVCPSLPAVLTMTSCDTSVDFGSYQPCTIRYQPTPAWAAPLFLGPHVYLSDETFPDPLEEDAQFHYLLQCDSGQFLLRKLFQSPPAPQSSPFLSGVVYYWAAGVSSGPAGIVNACSPDSILLNYGQAGDTGGTTACVTIYGGAATPGPCYALGGSSGGGGAYIRQC